MCRKQAVRHDNSMRHQRGFLVPLSLFIVIVLGVLALSMSRLTSGSYASAVLEAISTQAFYAAESGAQLSMNTLYFNASDKATTDANCVALDSRSDLSLTASGLNNCTIRFSCSISTAGTRSLYSVESAATCGSAQLVAERTIAVSGFME